MKDAQEWLDSKQVECLTVPSEACPENLCDGNGFLWYLNYDKKMNWGKYQKQIQALQIKAHAAREFGDNETADNIREEIKLINRIEWWEPCKCYVHKQRQAQIESIVKEAYMPLEFSKSKILGFKEDLYKQEASRVDAKIAKEMALNYVNLFETMKEKGKGIYLFSRTKGVGKTRLACSIGNSLMHNHLQTVLYAKAADISARVRKTFSKDAAVSEEDVIKAYRDVDVLIIDDFAVKEKDPTFMEKIYYRILDHRMEQKKVTIITSNITIDEINDYYPDPNQNVEGRVYSRVNKMCIVINMPEESIRDMEASKENEEIERLLLGRGPNDQHHPTT